MVRLTLAQIEMHNANIPVTVLLNLACIYKFQHTDRESGVKKTQIAVGIVTHQHNCPETGNLLYDMGCNIHFKSRIGKKSRRGR